MPLNVTFKSLSKKKETSSNRFQRLTKPYNEALEKNIWRTERRFCSEISQTMKNLGISYKLDRMTNHDSDSFLVAIMQQLRREDIYDLLEEDIKNLADEMKPWNLRGKILEFIKSSESDQLKILKINFEKEGPKETTWETFWKERRNRECLPSIWFIEAAAMCLQMDMIFVTIAEEKGLQYLWEVPCNVNHDDKKVRPIGTLVLGNKCEMYFVSLLLEENGEELKIGDCEKYDRNLWKLHKKEIDLKNKTEICPQCGKQFKRLLRHLSNTNSCNEKVSVSLVEGLKSRSKKNHKLSKAKSKKKIQTHESLEAREDRLAMKSYYEMKTRMKKTKAIKVKTNQDNSKEETNDKKNKVFEMLMKAKYDE